MNPYNDPTIPSDPLPRPTCAALDAILGRTHGVLHDGFIRVVDYLGTDASVVQAARVSYGAGTKTPSDDEQLIRFMMRHGHMTPFEQCELKLHMRLPMDVMRQVVRHRTAHVNEYSTRYSEAIDSQHEVAADEWRLQSSTNRQGSGETLSEWSQVPSEHWPVSSIDPSITCDNPGEYLTGNLQFVGDITRIAYQKALKFGVAREQARSVLPLSTYTEIYWKCDLRNLLGFLRLRLAPDAQKEIRDYANVIAEIVEQWVPMTWRAFQDYQLNSLTLSAEEIAIIREIHATGTQWDLIPLNMSRRELGELRVKLQRLGMLNGVKGGES